MVYKMDYLDLGSNCYCKRLGGGGGGGVAASNSSKKEGVEYIEIRKLDIAK